MMTAIAAGDFETAQKLMHPDAMEQASDFYSDWQSMCTYVNGVGVKKLGWTELTTIGTAGEGEFEERATYSIKMENGLFYEVKYTYEIDAAGTGFTDFHLSYK